MPKDAKDAWAYLFALLTKLGACYNLMSCQNTACPHCLPKNDEVSEEPLITSRRAAGAKKRQREPSSDDSDHSYAIKRNGTNKQ